LSDKHILLCRTTCSSTIPALNVCSMVLELVNITKKFGGHPVLENVSLQVKAGEIHGLVGLNGSGKSTLLNILFGSRIIAETGGFSGSFLLEGKSCRFSQPCQAVRCGIGMVHQEQALIPDLSIAENIRITREPVHRFNRILPRVLSPINTAAMEDQGSRALARLGIIGYSAQQTGTLPLTIRQFIEIAREISRDDLKLLLLDEPTAVFSRDDTVRLQSALRELAGKGVAILFVSHRLEEIVNICDRLTVLRDGRISAQLQGDELSPSTISQALMPHDVIKTRKSSCINRSSARLSIRNFQVEMPGDELKDLDLTIRSAEIFGLTGLSGSGHNSLAKGVMGLCHRSGDVELVELDGTPLPLSPQYTARQMLHAGFFFLSEERQKNGLLLQHSIRDNIVFSSLHVAGKFARTNRLLRGAFPDKKIITEHANRCVRKFSIGCRDIHQKVSELSGGNQQKVCMAHALTLAPSVLFINEPTRGVDIAAKEIILEQIITTSREHGTTIIVSSSELDELRRICDRIGVLYKGNLQAILAPNTEESIFASAVMGEWRQA